MTNIYIGNLAWKAKKEDLQSLFSNFGLVSRAFIVRDKKTKKSRGFGFVEMVHREEALAAIEVLHNTKLFDRVIAVNEAKPREVSEEELMDEEES